MIHLRAPYPVLGSLCGEIPDEPMATDINFVECDCCYAIHEEIMDLMNLQKEDDDDDDQG